MKKINLIFALLLSLMGVTQVKADELTVYEGTKTNDYVPIYGYYADAYEKCEFIIPSTVLADMNGSQVSEMKFYSSSSSISWGNAVFKVFLKEVGNTVLSAFLGDSDATTVYEGSLNISGGQMVVSFSENYTYNGGNLLVGVYETTTGSYSKASFYGVAQDGATAYRGYSSTSLNSVSGSAQYFLPKTTFTYEQAVEGPGFAAYDGTTKLASPYSYDFGLSTAGTTKTFTLKNPGTADLSISVSETGNFGATLSSNTIAAGGETTLTVTMPNATGSSTVTITPDAEGIDPFVINVSGTIRDANKLYEKGFTALPEDWTTTGTWYYNADNGAYTTSWYLSSNARLITPLLTISEGETFVVEAKGYSTSNTSYQHLQMQYSADGTTWTNFDAEPALDPSTWNTYTFTGVPAGTYYIAINASQADVRMFYGGVLDETPRPKLEVEGIANGGSLSWGYSDVSAGTTKTITLKNDGTADLDVTIAATDDYTVDPASATIEAGGTVVVTIGTPAHDGNGVLTITPAEGSGLSPYTINLTSYWKEPKPVMALDKTSIAFGKVNEVKSETITVSNTGDADLVVTIANDNTENFSVEPADQLIVAPGEEGTITITYNFVEGTWGTFNANVKVTPNYGGTYDAKTITVSATSKDPNVWDEDFESGVLDQDWIASGWSISTPGSYSGGNGTKMVGGNSRTATLITPRLIATEGQQLTFELGGSSSSYPLAVEYSTDRESWTEVASFTEDGTCSIDAPVTDPTTFYLRFTGWVYIDNLNGFKLDKPEHDAAITAVSIPATGNQYVEYTASVTVKELAGKDENVNVEFYLGEDMAGEASGTLDPNGTETFEVKFTPTAPFEGEASFTVTFVSDDDEVFATFETDPVEVTIAAAPVLDETTGSLDDFENWGRYDVIELKYSLKEGWNTVILPFAWSDLSVFGEGAKAYSFDNYTNGAIDFKAVNELNVQTPYIIYAPAAKDKVVFLNVTNFRTSTEATDLSISHNGAVFQGTYAPIAAPGMQGKYGVVPSSGKIAKGGVNATLKGFRGYFELPAGATGAKINFYDENDNLIDAIDAVELNNAINGNLYDLSGRKVEGKAKAGVYIQNGKKVVVK